MGKQRKVVLIDYRTNLVPQRRDLGQLRPHKWKLQLDAQSKF